MYREGVCVINSFNKFLVVLHYLHLLLIYHQPLALLILYTEGQEGDWTIFVFQGMNQCQDNWFWVLKLCRWWSSEVRRTVYSYDDFCFSKQRDRHRVDHSDRWFHLFHQPLIWSFIPGQQRDKLLQKKIHWGTLLAVYRPKFKWLDIAENNRKSILWAGVCCPHITPGTVLTVQSVDCPGLWLNDKTHKHQSPCPLLLPGH